MSRPIDAEKLVNIINPKGLNNPLVPLQDIMRAIAITPTEDVEPVVHAHWIHRTRDHRNDYYDVLAYPYICSACRVKSKELTKRCPECGAKMAEKT